MALQSLATGESDLIAYMLGGAIVALLVFSLLISVFIRRRLASRLIIEPHVASDDRFSKTDISAGLRIRGATLAPFFSLQIHRHFQHEGATSPRHIVTGSDDNRSILDTIRFPHRGHWAMSHFDVSLRDALGFTEITWQIPCEASVEVSARNIQLRPLPIVAASSRAGDMLDEAQERSGDLFDIKQYDPSDGVKRILWKTYAKTAQVVVRRPEPAIIPEGEVAVYAIAHREDDIVAGALQHYLQELERNSITILFGTDGTTTANEALGIKSSQSTAAQMVIASAPERIQQMINHAVWSPLAGSGSGFNAYLEALKASNRVVRRVVIFAPERNSGWLDTVRRAATAHQVALTLVIAPDHLDPDIDFINRSARFGSAARGIYPSFLQRQNNDSPQQTSLLGSPALSQAPDAELLVCERAA